MNKLKFSLFLLFLALGISATSTTAQPDRLIEFITDQQDLHVKKSCTLHSNFSDIDFEKFLANDVVNQIIKELENDTDFANVVTEIKALSETDRNALLKKAKNTYLPTWAQNGRISCEGQTDAGQSAQKRISFAVVKLVKRMMNGA